MSNKNQHPGKLTSLSFIILAESFLAGTLCVCPSQPKNDEPSIIARSMSTLASHFFDVVPKNNDDSRK
jgi:hypothetical protein